MNKLNKENLRKAYYVQRQKDFNHLEELMMLMPSFSTNQRGTEDFLDTYYETEDMFLKTMGITVRLRTYKTKQILSVKYSDEVLAKQDNIYKNPINEKEIDAGIPILDQSNLVFIEAKINLIYSNKLKIDILRKLRQMRAIYTIKTKRTILEVAHNTGFRANIFFDAVHYNNSLTLTTYADLILKINMISPDTDFNKQLLHSFIAELRRKMILVPMVENKYEAAILFTRFKK